jgi:hypothetical protein
MDYQISDKAKKVTLGLSIVGLIMVVVGFFQQKITSMLIMLMNTL